MIVGGVDLGGRKAAISIWNDGVLHHVTDLEVARTTRSLELRTLAEWSENYLKVCHYVCIEEAQVGRGIRASLQVAQTCGAVMAVVGKLGHTASWVPVSTWKKEVVGKGNVGKPEVKAWLLKTYPAYAALCGSSQDRIDATCIGLYGVRVAERSRLLEAL